MKELDKTKAYDLSNLNDEELEQFRLECLKDRATNPFESLNFLKSKTYIYAIFNDINYENSWCVGKETQREIIDAKELFQEWKPKQGDPVRVTDERNKCIGTFVCTYKGHYLIDNKERILIASQIKQLEHEIKVGDWVKNPHAIYKVEIDDDLDRINYDIGHKKITNPELIELLEQEFKTK